jgi:NAD(P)-dependent dehydrogenase (short-subunit alcohol dehydrogenase family)
MGKLDGKIAVITGGDSGLGLATAERFVAEGAFVFITGRRQQELDAAARKIGRNAAAVQGDVSKLDDLDSVLRRSSSKRAGSTCSSRTPGVENSRRSAKYPRRTSTRRSTST